MTRSAETDSPMDKALPCAAEQHAPKPRLLGRALSEHEIKTLQELAAHHPYADFRRRALGVLALNNGYRVVQICQMLQVSDQPVYNWAKGWRTQGLVALLGGHKGGAPRKLTEQMLDEAEKIARQEALTLGKILQRVRERFADAPSFSVDRLSAGLKARGLSYKRGRMAVQKSVIPANSSA